MHNTLCIRIIFFPLDNYMARCVGLSRKMPFKKKNWKTPQNAEEFWGCEYLPSSIHIWGMWILWSDSSEASGFCTSIPSFLLAEPRRSSHLSQFSSLAFDVFYGASEAGTSRLGPRLPLVTCDQRMSAGRISNISSGSPSLYALLETGAGIDLVCRLEFLLGANKNNYKKIIKGLTFCCTHE